MRIFGINGIHTTEACPLNNLESAKAVTQMSLKSGGKEVKEKYKINRIIGQYHSALEHTFIWIVEADDAHLIEKFCIEIEMAKFNAVKIIPLTLFEEIVNKCSLRLA
jgi:uncharacterized protein with GYD domain